MSVSASLITRDEEVLLPACLASLKPLVDEIVVYDTGSTDATISIARAAGATVIAGFWNNDFARARNAALDACPTDWVLSLSADDTVHGHPQALRDAVERTSQSVLALPLKRVDGPPIPSATLLRKSVYRWSGAVHEVPWPIVGAPIEPPAMVSQVFVRKHRTSRDVASQERNLAIAASAVARGDVSPFPGWPHLAAAVSAATLGHVEDAEGWLEAAGRLSDQWDARARVFAKVASDFARAEIANRR
ncbi:MAG TPA: glycosyltransferase family 2 protein [Acidimicrobiales bacterium]|nr:glycosyltransferase family 2 protein [Acidimicrobiales bacterium]